jgi:negative regulator of sigma-B (phosphoserine phosphatase)
MRASIAHRSTPKQGETASGDRPFVQERDGEVFVAVIDALGHGPRAEEAAVCAVQALDSVEPGTPLAARFERVHEALKRTRGAAMTAILVVGSRVTVAGIGDVSFRCSGTSVPFLPTPGVLGSARRPLRVAEAVLGERTRFVLHSDGVSSRFSLETVASLDAAGACEALFSAHAGTHDDATLLVLDP